MRPRRAQGFAPGWPFRHHHPAAEFASLATARRTLAARGFRFLVDATISRDGAMVLAGGADGYLRFWDMASARMIWAVATHRSYVVGVHFQSNDLVTRGFSGDVARWSLPTPAAIIDACGLASEESAGDDQPCVIVPR